MNSMADRLFGSTEAQAAAPAAAPAPTTTGMAARLFPEAPARYEDTAAPDAVKAGRAADTGRRLYSPQAVYAAQIPDAPDIDAPAWREVAADLNATPDDAAQFVALVRDLPRVTEDERGQWAAQSKALDIAPADLMAAREFVARDQRLYQLLDDSGLGSHPKVVAWAVAQARSRKARG